MQIILQLVSSPLAFLDSEHQYVCSSSRFEGFLELHSGPRSGLSTVGGPKKGLMTAFLTGLSYEWAA